MRNYQYNVTLQTPMGERYGEMTVTIERDRIKGTLTILKKTTPFHGVMLGDENCRISGELITLMRTIAYEAMGKINEKSLHLILKSEREVLELFGTIKDACPSREKEKL